MEVDKIGLVLVGILFGVVLGIPALVALSVRVWRKRCRIIGHDHRVLVISPSRRNKERHLHRYAGLHVLCTRCGSRFNDTGYDDDIELQADWSESSLGAAPPVALFDYRGKR